MLTLLFRKMRNTKWMVLCLLIGFIMASAMMSTIPIYMNGSLQRMLVKDMEAFQIENDIFPGVYTVEKNLSFSMNVNQQREFVINTEKIVEERIDALSIPVKINKTFVADDYLYVKSMEVSAGNSVARVQLGAMDDIVDHINITRGRMYEIGAVDGVYETIASELALKTAKITTDTVYELANVFNPGDTIKVKIVGIYEQKDNNDAYWSEGINSYLNTLIIDKSIFMNEIINTGISSISTTSIKYSLDYQNADMTNLNTVKEQLKLQTGQYKEEGLIFAMPVKDILIDYAARATQLKQILWLLQIPVMLMLVFYLFMVSQLNVEQERNEIAIFKSRGASAFQILKIYGIESAILGILTAVIGPFMGLFLCRILGVSNGFLEFVNRPALSVKLSLDSFLYALAAVAVFFITTMVPIIPATKTSIVAHKQRKARASKRTTWEKSFLDIILLGGSIYWLFSYNSQQEKLIKQGIEDTAATIQPIMFVASTAFILGAGLFFLRVYPYIIRLIYKLGKRVWTPAAYVSLNNVGRSSSGRERFLMTFLILTVSLGLYSANTARALNTNMEERVRYEIGADVTIKETWYNSNMGGLTGPSPNGEQQDTTVAEEDTSTIQYIEPVFEKYEQLPGVEKATKVFIRDNITVQTNETTNSDTKLMSIIPSQFADVAWFRDDLLATHINNYLDALSSYKSGVILSHTYATKYDLKLGDKIEMKWSKNNYFDATVLAFVDYWPGINPYEKNDAGEYIDFAIMNFDYVRVQTAIEPYEVWISLKEGASTQALYDGITQSKIVATELNDANQTIIKNKNDPMLQGMNGALTLGFIIIMIMCIIGFLIYWILSIKSRTLQFGILRAMGMSFREIIAMLFYEQVLVSGAAIVLAIVIGGIASDLFVPLFQALYNVTEQVPPFKVIAMRSDYIKLYVIIGAMLICGFVVLGRLISKIKISQALKLGED